MSLAPVTCSFVKLSIPSVRSIASEIAAVVMEQGFDDLDAPVLRVANEDVPLPYAANLEKMALIDKAKVIEAVRKVTYAD